MPHPKSCTFAFPTARGGGHFVRVGLPIVLARICALAEMQEVTVHVLRYSFAATAAGIGFSELTIAAMLGHRLPGVTARYAYVANSALIAVADRVAGSIVDAMV